MVGSRIDRPGLVSLPNGETDSVTRVTIIVIMEGSLQDRGTESAPPVSDRVTRLALAGRSMSEIIVSSPPIAPSTASCEGNNVLLTGAGV